MENAIKAYLPGKYGPADPAETHRAPDHEKKIIKKLKLAQPAADNQFGYFRILPVKPADHRQSKKTALATCA
jgi:hypothetical protein